MRDSFVFYRSFAEAIKFLPDDERLRLFDGLIAYALDDTEPGFDGVALGMFTLIKPQVDANNRKYENGKKGGRPSNENQTETKTKPNDNQDGTKAEPNVNDNYNANLNSNGKENGSTDVWSLSRSVLSYLNQVAGTSYRLDGASSVRLISELAHNGYTEEQMKSVIDKKAGQWLGDPKVEQYLRPSTLFGPKFEQYLNEPDTAGKKARDEAEDKKRKQTEARKELEEAEKQMALLREEFEDADGDIQRRIDIKGRMAVLDAKMEVLQVRAGPEYGKGGSSA